MNDIKFENWRLTVFWVAVAVASAIGGLCAGWSWRDRSGALASVSLLSALTALGTVGALFVGLFLAYRDAAWRRQSRHERSEFMLQALRPEFRRISALLSNLLVAAESVLRAVDKAERQGRDFALPKYVPNSLRAAAAGLSAPTALQFRTELVDLENGLGVFAIRVATELPRVVAWVEECQEFGPPELNPMLYFAQFSVIGREVAELGVDVTRILIAAGEGQAQATLFERYLKTGKIAAA